MQIQSLSSPCFCGVRHMNKFAKKASDQLDAVKSSIHSDIEKAEKLNKYAIDRPNVVFPGTQVEMIKDNNGTVIAREYSSKILRKEITYVEDENNELRPISIREYIPKSKKINLYLYGDDEIVVNKGLQTNKNGDIECDECIQYCGDYQYYFLRHVKQDAKEGKVTAKSGMGVECGTHFAYKHIKTNKENMLRAEEKIMFDENYKAIAGYDRKKLYISLGSDKLEEVKN